jgi:hypothetical protein
LISTASRRSVRRSVSIESVAEVCDFVDGLDGSAVGELVIADANAVGVVFVEKARICWAAATGLGRRLTELLVARAAVDEETMESLYRTCKAERVPLGEYLVGRGIVGPADLRAALAQHTVESLRRLAGPGQRAGWCPKERGGYSPRFTFGTAELLARAGEVDEAEAARAVREEMAACFFEGEWAAAFVRSPARAVPVPIAIHGEAPAAASELLRVGGWAASALDVASALDGQEPVLAVRLARPTCAEREMRVALRHGALLIAGESSARGPARILNRRVRRREGS